MRGVTYHSSCLVLLAITSVWQDCCAKPEVHKFWPSGFLGDFTLHGNALSMDLASCHLSGA